MLGWAIQKGHTITWSDRHKNYMPNIAGTAEEWWLGGTVVRDHIGWMDGVGSVKPKGEEVGRRGGWVAYRADRCCGVGVAVAQQSRWTAEGEME